MGVIPWAAVFNFLITITMMVIKKLDEKNELEKEFVKFVTKAHEKKALGASLMRRYQNLKRPDRQ